MVYKQATQTLTGLALLLTMNIGCAGGTDPFAPNSEFDSSPNAETPQGPDDEPYIREVTGTTAGTAGANGPVVTQAGYVNQPAIRSMNATAGEFIFLRVRPRMSDNSTNMMLASSYISETVNYGYSISNTFEASTCEMRYVVVSEKNRSAAVELRRAQRRCASAGGPVGLHNQDCTRTQPGGARQ